jgi:signal transduction histidine kinase
MNLIRKHSLLISIFAGAVIGDVFLHPFGMVIHQIFHLHENGTIHIQWNQLVETYLTAFTMGHLPQSILYIILGGFMGYLVGKTISAYKVIAENNKRLSIIGKNTAGIIHDLNNPLAVMAQSINLLCKEVDSEKRNKYCGMMSKQVSQFSRIIGDIKLVALGENPITLSRVDINIDEFLNDIVEKTNFRSSVKIHSEIEEKILADKDQLERVVWNLLKNADEALIGSKNALIEVTIRKQNNVIVMSVKDNGPGIPGKIVNSLFELGTTYDKSSGSGIGLYNCKTLIEAHGGKIWVDSKLGEGATFYFTIPQ